MNLTTIHNYNIKFYLFSILIAATIVIVLPVLPQLIILPFLVLLYFVYRENFMILLVILAFVTATGFILEEKRSLVNLLLISITGVVFFRYYGFDLKKYPSLPKYYLQFLGLLFSMLIISSLFSNHMSTSLIATLRTAIFLTISYAFYSFLFMIKDTYLYIYALFLAVVVLSFGIMLQIMEAGFTLFLIEGGLARFSGFYANPNYVGHILIITVSFIITFYFRESFKDKIKIIWLTAFLILNLFIIFAVDSRASALAILISTSFILLTLNKRIYFTLLFSVGLVFLILYLIPSIQELVDIFMRVERLDTRTYFWEAGIDVISDYPIFGVGPDQFQNFIFTYLPSEAYKYFQPDVWFGTKANPHNFFLLMISENGLLGILTSLSLFVLYFYFGFRAIKMTKHDHYDIYLLSVSLTGIGFGIFIRAFYEVTGIMSYGYITRDLPFWLLLNVLMFINVKYSNWGSNPAPSTPKDDLNVDH
jgi:O-antigen ligase